MTPDVYAIIGMVALIAAAIIWVTGMIITIIVVLDDVYHGYRFSAVQWVFCIPLVVVFWPVAIIIGVSIHLLEGYS